MTLNTRDCGVPPRQRETGGLMFRQSKTRGLERGPIVTLFAAVIPGCTGKLPFVLIPVAINTKCMFDFETGVLSCWNMTLRALHRGMRKD